MIPQNELSKIVTIKIAAMYYPILIREMAPAGIDTKNEQCAFIAELINEGLMKPSEDLRYSAATLFKFWPKVFETLENAKLYAYKPEEIANKVYGRPGNDLGNTQPGDGWKFRGRGCIGITGRAEYAKCGKGLGIDLITHPELLELPEWGVKSAIWFWNDKKLSSEADKGNIDRVSRGINRGSVNSKYKAIHEAERHTMYDKLLTLWVA